MELIRKGEIKDTSRNNEDITNTINNNSQGGRVFITVYSYVNV